MATMYSRDKIKTGSSNPLLDLPHDQRDAVLALLYRVVLIKDTPLYDLLVELEGQVDPVTVDKILSGHKITAHFKSGMVSYEVADFDLVVENGK